MTTDQLKGLAETMRDMTKLGETPASNKDLWFKAVSPKVVLELVQRIEQLEAQQAQKAA
ncbi:MULTISPECIES: hypothetical protein [unclassified Neptuniibacter]|uniref:hypothetical protein n=1 Tax=unclassified Neptuniibacter TaxID=2630693 RepID=UPI0025E40860|nr:MULTISPECIES: hypothetical protein [unclassified Neptuniibacter]|tara:strand:+ start:12454 stop:12630 length:177 start_codon:yes stop_codon:yes gene_type:complete